MLHVYRFQIMGLRKLNQILLYSTSRYKIITIHRRYDFFVFEGESNLLPRTLKNIFY